MRDIKTINSLIKAIKKNAVKQREDVQKALNECALFAFEDRNVDPAIRLFEAVGNGTNRKAMSHWLSINACIHFKDGKPMLSDKRQKEMANTMVTADVEVELAKSVPWYELAQNENTPENIWDGAQKLAGLRKYLEKLAKDAQANGDNGLAGLVSELTANINSHEFDVVEK